MSNIVDVLTIDEHRTNEILFVSNELLFVMLGTNVHLARPYIPLEFPYNIFLSFSIVKLTGETSGVRVLTSTGTTGGRVGAETSRVMILSDGLSS